LEVCYVTLNSRSISTIASVLWLFLEDVDILQGRKPGMYLVLGRKPRKLLKPEHLAENPEVIKRGKTWTP